MSSIALVLTRDFLRRTAWPALFSLGYMIGLPAMFYFLARAHGMTIPAEAVQRSALGFHIGCFIGFMMVVWVAQGENRFGVGPRLYVLPIETWFVVGCRMLQAGLIVAALGMLTVGAYNLLFGLTWPLGLAWPLAVAALWVQAGLWTLLDFRFSKLVVVGLVLASLVWWIVTRHCDGVGVATWAGPTPGEALVLVAYTIAAYVVGVEGVARHRRGDCESLTAWLARVDQWLGARLERRPVAFRSAEEALLWKEWLRAGMALPSITAGVLAIVLLAGAIRVALGWTTPQEVLQIELVLALFAQPQIGLVMGLVLGHRNQSSGRLEFDSYSATRPVSDRTMSEAILRAGRRAVLMSYGAAALCCLITAGWVHLREGSIPWQEVQRLLPQELAPLGGWSAVVVCGQSLLTTWTFLGLATSTILCGHMKVPVRILAGGVVGLMSWTILVKFLVPPHVGDFLSAAGCAVIGLACLGGTAWAFAAARRRGLVSTRCVWSAILSWLALCGILAVVASFASQPRPVPASVLQWLALPLLPGMLALPLAPLATIPLTLAWNRHR
jgi:hypothetical protein